MDIRVSFPSGRKVVAQVEAHVVITDRSLAHGGTDTAPEPVDLFLALLATCAAAVVGAADSGKARKTRAAPPEIAVSAAVRAA